MNKVNTLTNRMDESEVHRLIILLILPAPVHVIRYTPAATRILVDVTSAAARLTAALSKCFQLNNIISQI